MEEGCDWSRSFMLLIHLERRRHFFAYSGLFKNLRSDNGQLLGS